MKDARRSSSRPFSGPPSSWRGQALYRCGSTATSTGPPTRRGSGVAVGTLQPSSPGRPGASPSRPPQFFFGARARRTQDRTVPTDEPQQIAIPAVQVLPCAGPPPKSSVSPQVPPVPKYTTHTSPVKVPRRPSRSRPTTSGAASKTLFLDLNLVPGCPSSHLILPILNLPLPLREQPANPPTTPLTPYTPSNTKSRGASCSSLSILRAFLLAGCVGSWRGATATTLPPQRLVEIPPLRITSNLLSSQGFMTA